MRVYLVIEQLVFEPNGRPRVIFGKSNKIFYTAVGSWCKLKFKRKIKCPELFKRYNITAISGFPSFRRNNFQDPFFNQPSAVREGFAVSSFPPCRAFTVK